MTSIRADPFSAQALAAIDVIDNIFDGRIMPLGDGLFSTIAGMLFEILESTEDRDLIQTGLHIVTTVIRKDVNQLLNWFVFFCLLTRAWSSCLHLAWIIFFHRYDAQGRSGLSQVLSIVSRLLEPSESESGGLFVGDLVIHLIRTAGSSLGDVLPGLLTAFVTRLASAKTASFSQVASTSSIVLVWLVNADYFLRPFRRVSSSLSPISFTPNPILFCHSSSHFRFQQRRQHRVDSPSNYC